MFTNIISPGQKQLTVSKAKILWLGHLGISYVVPLYNFICKFNDNLWFARRELRSQRFRGYLITTTIIQLKMPKIDKKTRQMYTIQIMQLHMYF